MTTGKIALITGANKGIGYSIVKELCYRDVSVVYLASRDVNRGTTAVKYLKNQGFNPEFIQLDVCDKESVKAAAEKLKEKHGGIDILINNAGVATETFSKTTYEDAVRVIDVNYRSILTIQEHFFPILKDNARVINLSSDCGHISNIKHPYWISRLTKKDVTVEEIDEFVDWYLRSVKYGFIIDVHFSETTVLAYRISKVALTALTMVQQREIGRNISVNAVHPGFVQTDMTKSFGNFKADVAADTPVYLALDAPQTLKGSYVWYDKTVYPWDDPNLHLYFKLNYMTVSSLCNNFISKIW